MKQPNELSEREYQWVKDHMDEVTERLERVAEIVDVDHEDKTPDNSRSHLLEAKSYADSYHLQVIQSEPGDDS